ncbi:MAG: hypothetical protein WD060_08240 [Pirellulales bacterium]
MNRPTPKHPASPLTFDDPRISEWIDGRLVVSDADFVARAVAASPELTRFVDDLRLLKAAVAGVEAAQPPAGFVRTVMEAVASEEPVEAGDDSAVEAEWQRLEAERIAEEIEEARDDVADATRQQRRPPWTWLAMLASLAAGVLVAAGLNLLPQQGGREVAMAPDGGPTSETQAKSERDDVLWPTGSERAPNRKAAPAVPMEAAGKALALADGADAAAVDEFVVMVDGPRGRATLARLLAKSGLGGAAAALKEDRLEVAAAAISIEAFKAALGELAEGGVRLPEAAKSFHAARSAGAVDTSEIDTSTVARDRQAKAELELSRPTDTIRRLVIRIVADDEPLSAAPAAAASPTPSDLEE